MSLCPRNVPADVCDESLPPADSEEGVLGKPNPWAPVTRRPRNVSAVCLEDLGRLDTFCERLCNGLMCQEMVRECIGVGRLNIASRDLIGL